MIFLDYRLTTIQVFYFRPDYEHLLQEFMWSTLDLPPDFPRMHRFVDYWQQHIHARIKQIILVHTDPLGGKVHRVDQEFLI